MAESEGGSGATVRFGILGAARIAPNALIRPARQVAGAHVAAVAARDPARARSFARRHGIPRVHDDYAALLADPELDAIYNPLPNALHCEWTVRALEAGKHVLCEKPLASNEDEARRMAEAARASGRVLVEAFHYRYHPLSARIREILRSGEIGAVQHMETEMCVPLPLPGDIRFDYALGGGATMDIGCYAVSMLRMLADAEPEVVSAEARLSSPRVDRWMRAELRFPDGRTGRVTGSLFSRTLLRLRARVQGDAGELTVTNPLVPHLFHRLKVVTPEGKRVEKVPGRATYTHQLEAFVAQLGGGPAMETDPDDAIANMRVIDAIYDAAGLPRRGTWGPGFEPSVQPAGSVSAPGLERVVPALGQAHGAQDQADQ